MSANDTPPAAAMNAAVGVKYPVDSVVVSDNHQRLLLTNTPSPLHESTVVERTNQRRVILPAPNELAPVVESINSKGVIILVADTTSPYE